jgi:hypothetical protein
LRKLLLLLLAAVAEARVSLPLIPFSSIRVTKRVHLVFDDSTFYLNANSTSLFIQIQRMLLYNAPAIC